MSSASTARSPWLDRYMALSPGRRIAVAGIGVLALGLFINDYVWSYATEWNARADQLESLLHRGAQRQAALPKDVERAVIAFGKAEIPSDEATTSQSLAKAITETLRKHRIANSGYESLQGGKLPTTAFSAIAGAGQRIERIRGQVSFETDADEVAGILSDLEAHSDVDSLYSIRINRVGDTKRVSIKLVAEAWARAAKETRRGTGP